MGAKSRIKKWNFSYLCLFSLANVFAFPHTNTLEVSQAAELGEEIANIHQTLQAACRVVPSAHNRFACAFRFVKTVGAVKQSLVIYVTNRTSIKIFESGWSPVSGLRPIDVCNTLKTQVHDSFFYSISRNPPGLTLSTVLLASTYELIHSRYNHTGMNQPLFRINNIDSEAKAIAYLYREAVTNAIAQKVLDWLREGGTITHIELHGFTDRDMCALCYTNFNMIIELTCYNPLELYPTFLTKLKNQLGTRCPSPTYAIYISSSQPFPRPNILWNPRLNPPGPCTYAGHVNQFRINQLPANDPIEVRHVVTPDINRTVPPAPRSSAAGRGR